MPKRTQKYTKKNKKTPNKKDPLNIGKPLNNKNVENITNNGVGIDHHQVRMK